MANPALNFVAVCANANLPVQGNKNQFLKVLKESGASIGSFHSLPDIKERFAALTWVRHAVANAIDPASWLSTLSAPLLDYRRSLYPIPPPVRRSSWRNRSSSAREHGLLVHPGRSARCFHYFCVHFGGYLQWRHQHYAPTVRSTSLGARSYGVLRFSAGSNGH